MGYQAGTFWGQSPQLKPPPGHTPPTPTDVSVAGITPRKPRPQVLEIDEEYELCMSGNVTRPHTSSTPPQTSVKRRKRHHTGDSLPDSLFPPDDSLS